MFAASFSCRWRALSTSRDSPAVFFTELADGTAQVMRPGDVFTLRRHGLLQGTVQVFDGPLGILDAPARTPCAPPEASACAFNAATAPWHSSSPQPAFAPCRRRGQERPRASRLGSFQDGGRSDPATGHADCADVKLPLKPEVSCAPSAIVKPSSPAIVHPSNACNASSGALLRSSSSASSR